MSSPRSQSNRKGEESPISYHSSDPENEAPPIQNIVHSSSQRQIIDFFVAWFDTIRHRDRVSLEKKGELYTALFLNPTFQATAILSAAEIESFNEESTGTEKSIMALRHATPYHINRILLHGMLIKPEEWSPSFAKAFKTILAFLKDPLSTDILDILGGEAFKEYSYPPILIKQLEYLETRYDHHTHPSDPPALLSKRPHSNHMFFLPEDIRSAEDWFDLVWDLRKTHPAVWESIYQAHQAQIDMLLNKYYKEEMSSELGYRLISVYLPYIPPKQRAPYLKQLLGNLERDQIASSVSASGKVYPMILELFPEEDREICAHAILVRVASGSAEASAGSRALPPIPLSHTTTFAHAAAATTSNPQALRDAKSRVVQVSLQKEQGNGCN